MYRRRSPLLQFLLLAACRADATDSGPVELRVEPDLVIASEEDLPQSFADVRGVQVDGAGRIWVLETSVPEVRVFDREGGFIRTIGRRGRGPGEFVHPNGIAFTPAGHLMVYDPRADRVTVFDTAGGLVTTHPLMITSFGYLWDGGVDSVGRVLDHQVRRVDTTLVPVVRRFDPATGSSDTLPLPDCGTQDAPTYRFEMGIMTIPFATGGRSQVESSGWVWCMDTGAALAWRWPLVGDVPPDTFASAAAPEPVTPAERQEAERRVEEFRKDVGGSQIDLGMIPRVKPVLEGVDGDAQGRVWMRVRDSAGPAFHLFAPDGRWIARLRHGQDLSPWHRLVVRGDTVVAVGRDSLDVPMILRFVVPVSGLE